MAKKKLSQLEKMVKAVSTVGKARPPKPDLYGEHWEETMFEGVDTPGGVMGSGFFDKLRKKSGKQKKISLGQKGGE